MSRSPHPRVDDARLKAVLNDIHTKAEAACPENPPGAYLEAPGGPMPAPYLAMRMALLGMPKLTWGLIGLNVAFYLLTLLLSGLNLPVLELLQTRGYSAYSSALLILGANLRELTVPTEWYRQLSATFLHGGLLHLGMNMLGVWSLGQMCETLFGRKRFFVLYMLSGLGGSVLSSLMGPGGMSVGASGAVFGLMGAMLIFPRRAGKVLPPELTSRMIQQTTPWLVYNLFFTFTAPRIDIGGHLGGLAVGAGLAMLLGSPVVNPWKLQEKRFQPVFLATLLLTAALAIQWGLQTYALLGG